MDGRTLGLATALLLASCSSGALDSIESVRDARIEEAIEERPSLDEIFRDGRYSFKPAPRRVAAAAERSIKRHPSDDDALEELVAHQVVEGTKPGEVILVFGIVTADEFVEPESWGGFLRGASEAAELEEDTLDGVATAYGKTAADHTLAVNYAPDLIITISAMHSTKASKLEDIAEYLLEAR